MKISKSTIIRTILVAIVIINFILEKLGVDLIPVDESIIGMFVETFVEIAVIVVGFWKNNSFSQAAIRADEFLKELRNDDAEWEGEIEAEDPIESEVE
jgi:SPP1 family holin